MCATGGLLCVMTDRSPSLSTNLNSAHSSTARMIPPGLNQKRFSGSLTACHSLMLLYYFVPVFEFLMFKCIKSDFCSPFPSVKVSYVVYNHFYNLHYLILFCSLQLGFSSCFRHMFGTELFCSVFILMLHWK